MRGRKGGRKVFGFRARQPQRSGEDKVFARGPRGGQWPPAALRAGQLDQFYDAVGTHSCKKMPSEANYAAIASTVLAIKVAHMVTLLPGASSAFADPQRAGDAAGFCQHADWLRHSRQIERLWRPAGVDQEIGVSCGPMAFAAVTKLRWDHALRFFPHLERKLWVNRTEMEEALREIGCTFSRIRNGWPSIGLCLLHFTGPWSRSGYPAALLKQTHWIGVIGEYVFDVTWNGWLPRRNWEDVVIEEILSRKSTADGWIVLTGYEIEERASWLDLECVPHAADERSNC